MELSATTHSNCLLCTMDLSAIILQQLFILDHGFVSHHPTGTGHSSVERKTGLKTGAKGGLSRSKKMRTTTGIESFCCMWKNDSDQDDENYNLKKVMSFDVIHSRFRKNTHDVPIRSMHISESQALTFLWSSFYCIYQY